MKWTIHCLVQFLNRRNKFMKATANTGRKEEIHGGIFNLWIKQVNLVEGSSYSYARTYPHCSSLIAQQLESIQGTCRQSLKMGRGDMQKNFDELQLTVINIDLRSSEMPPLPNNGTFKLISWTFICWLNIL